MIRAAVAPSTGSTGGASYTRTGDSRFVNVQVEAVLFGGRGGVGVGGWVLE